MFGKSRKNSSQNNLSPEEATKIMSEVSTVFADLNEQGLLIKPSSKLPRAWHLARESFIVSYESSFHQIPENLKDSYHQVYSELAFFVNDKLFLEYNKSLEIAIEHAVQYETKLGISANERICRMLIESDAVKIQTKEEIWKLIVNGTTHSTCPKEHLIRVAETLNYCGSLYRTMWDEWAYSANFISYLKKGNPTSTWTLR